MKLCILFIIISLLVAVFSCKSERENSTNPVKKEADSKISNDYTEPNTETIRFPQDSTSMLALEEKLNKNSIVPKYKYGILTRRLKGKVKEVVSTSYYQYITENGKIAPDFDGNYWYNFTVGYKNNGKYDWDDFGRNSGGVAFLKYKFDSTGNAIKIAYYDYMSGDTSSIIKCKYDQQNNMLEERYYEYMTGIPQTFSLYEYDNRNNLIQMNFYDSDRKLLTKRLWQYNNQGDEISHSEYNFDSDTNISEHNYKYSYEYDSVGNWIYQIVYENDEITHVEHRQIEYYE